MPMRNNEIPNSWGPTADVTAPILALFVLCVRFVLALSYINKDNLP